MYQQSTNLWGKDPMKWWIGQVIEIKLPFKKGDGESKTDSYGNDKTNDPSGKYLISGLRQIIGGQKSESQLTLIRDVFSA